MEAICCILILLCIFVGDLRIKERVESGKTESGRTEPEKGKSIAGGFIRLRKYHNRGAMLNIGQGRSGAVAALSVALCVVLSAAFVLSLGRRGNHLLRTGLAFLLGGAFSNTYDRLKRKYVVDYFSFGVRWKPLRNIVFNLSDFCILLGAVLLVLGAA